MGLRGEIVSYAYCVVVVVGICRDRGPGDLQVRIVVYRKKTNSDFPFFRFETRLVLCGRSSDGCGVVCALTERGLPHRHRGTVL